MKALLNDQVVAEANKDELIYIEGNWYFPLSSVKRELLHESDTPYNCPWKGECQYYDVGAGENVSAWSRDSAFSYNNPLPSAIERVRKDFTGYVAFWRDITVTE
jgi:uncharacterized protein (DUF427 family)